MASYDIMPIEEEFYQPNDNVTDLHAYYMSQFNLELENCNKKGKDSFKYGAEESFDFEVFDNWNNDANTATDFDELDKVIGKNVNDQNIKEVLLDLDNIDFDQRITKNNKEVKENGISFYENNDYIDDESLIDELCREDQYSPAAPESNEEYSMSSSEKRILPSIETAFSKKYCNYSIEETQLHSGYVNEVPRVPSTENTQMITSVEHFSYPNNILYNLGSSGQNYILPDTPTSVSEFNFERKDRTVSICESIESDVQSSSYYEDNSEAFEEDELFVNLEEFGLVLEKDNETTHFTESNENITTTNRTSEREKTHGERLCLWENCYERYPNQNTLVEHIERSHVNTYKGDEFSCLWKDCTRARRSFNARYKLLIHMRVHSGHKPNRCHHPGCGKAFSRLENLKIHVRSHTGERPYACLAPHCRKAFSNSSDRAKHQRTHFNARPYACGSPGCGKRYTDPSSLRKHLKCHPHAAARPCPPPRPPRVDTPVPRSPAKPATLRSIRDKLIVPRMMRV